MPARPRVSTCLSLSVNFLKRQGCFVTSKGIVEIHELSSEGLIIPQPMAEHCKEAFEQNGSSRQPLWGKEIELDWFRRLSSRHPDVRHTCMRAAREESRGGQKTLHVLGMCYGSELQKRSRVGA